MLLGFGLQTAHTRSHFVVLEKHVRNCIKRFDLSHFADTAQSVVKVQFVDLQWRKGRENKIHLEKKTVPARHFQDDT